MRLPRLAAAFSLTLLAHAAWADAYEAALEQAREAEQQGDLEAAAQTLRVAMEAWPQDSAVALALAALELRRGHLAEAEQAWRVALLRSPLAQEAHAGLVATLVSAARCAEARQAADEALAVDPTSLAASWLGACSPAAPEPRPSLGLAGSGYLYPGHRSVAWAAGSTLTLEVPVRGWSFGATVRATRIVSLDETLMASFNQFEGYLRAGYGTERWGASLQGALVADGSGTLGTSTHAGATLRFSPAGDLLLSGSASFYSDLTVYRLEPSYRFALGSLLHLAPALGLQQSEGKTYLTPSLTLSLDGKYGSLWVGGKFGEETRPAYLPQSVVYDLYDHVAWGGWAGARLAGVGPVGAQLAYSWDHLVAADGVSPFTSELHSLTFTLTCAF